MLNSNDYLHHITVGGIINLTPTGDRVEITAKGVRNESDISNLTCGRGTRPTEDQQTNAVRGGETGRNQADDRL